MLTPVNSLVLVASKLLYFKDVLYLSTLMGDRADCSNFLFWLVHHVT